MMVFGVDFVKNVMIFFQCLAGVRMREPEQRMLAATFMFMTAAALLNMFLFLQAIAMGAEVFSCRSVLFLHG